MQHPARVLIALQRGQPDQHGVLPGVCSHRDDLGLCLLWAHSHPMSRDAVDFSGDDLEAHRYAHPALIDMTHGRPVVGLVFGEEAVAGEVWAAGEQPTRLDSLRVVGRGLTTREIALQLGLGITTVDTYRARIKEKLNLKNSARLRFEASRWFKAGE